MTAWTITFPEDVFAALHEHLFPGDGDEHGAVVSAGVSRSDGTRLLAREVFPARDGIEYVAGERGYRMLTAAFVQEKILHCRDESLGYLAVHNHGGDTAVGFSSTDYASHLRGYPALIDVARGQPVGALVLASNAIDGELFFPDGTRGELEKAIVLGPTRREIGAHPAKDGGHGRGLYDRQSRLFGDAGQQLLRKLRVGVIGAGGVGTLMVEYLARLGVGTLVVVDPDCVEVTNLPRLPGSTLADVHGSPLARWRRMLGARNDARPLPKVELSRRLASQTGGPTQVESIQAEFQAADVWRRFVTCDYLFLAADSMQARLLFNAIVHQYFIPGVQVGSKVSIDAKTGQIVDVFSAVRPVGPRHGCLKCNGLITASGLQSESASELERQDQRYVNDPIVVAPSVITLNAVGAAHATDDFLFWAVGMTDARARSDYLTFRPRLRDVRFESPRRDDDCPECSIGGRAGRGDSRSLPVKAPGHPVRSLPSQRRSGARQRLRINDRR